MAFIDGEILTAKALNDAINSVNRENLIVIDGVEYQATGILTISIDNWWNPTTRLWTGYASAPRPYTPPAGWDIHGIVYKAPLDDYVGTVFTQGNNLTLRAHAIAEKNPGAKTFIIVWRLIKAS